MRISIFSEEKSSRHFESLPYISKFQMQQLFFELFNSVSLIHLINCIVQNLHIEIVSMIWALNLSFHEFSFFSVLQ